METKLKPFDLEAAKAGAAVVTRDGKPVRIICTDKEGSEYPVIALVKVNGGEHVMTYRLDGSYDDGSNPEYDLLMAPVRLSGWVNLYRYGDGGTDTGGTVYASESDARDKIASGVGRYIATIPVEWEE